MICKSLSALIPVTILALSGACGGSSPAPTGPATLSTVAISGAASLTTTGQTSQLSAMATLSDSTTQNVTSTATWQSSNSGVATISTGGLLTAIASGATTITATTQGKSGTFAVTVSIPSAATTFQGTLVGGQSGAVTFVIQAAIQPLGGTVNAQVTASSTLTLFSSGGNVTLTGTFDTSSGTLNVSGGGFVLTGTVSQGTISGTYTGPNGTRGGFAGLDATQNSITLYCGTFQNPGGAGTFGLQVSSNGAASMMPTSGDGTGLIYLLGRLSGTALSLTGVTTNNTSVTGVVSGGNVSGTLGGDGGTFAGTTSACR
jgi:hypothetical protein